MNVNYLFLVGLTLFFYMSNATQDHQTRLWKPPVQEATSYEQLIDTCMELWTSLDLVLAINTTSEQKEDICKELTDMIRDIHENLMLLDLVIRSKGEGDRIALKENLETVKESFKQLFLGIQDSSYKEGLFLLDAILSTLETPNKVNTQE